MFDKIASFFSRKGQNTPPPDPSPTIMESEEVSRRILLAEDNRINSKVACRQLQKLSYEVDAVINGQEALDVMAYTSYGLILMDCQMPIMDGFEATRQIRRSERTEGKKRIPIIAMTANISNADRQKCLDTGMDDFLSKPVQMAVLGQLIEKWL
ncbi:MAG: response regulator [Ardenticatenaceae bacterium]